MIVAHGLFSFQIGGSERVGADLALEIARRGHETHCFAFYDTDGPIRAELEGAGIRCHDLDYKTRPRLTRRFSYQWEFYRFLRRHSIDALVVHHATGLIICGLPTRLARTPSVVMIEHGIHQLRDRPDYRRSARRYCGFAHHVVGIDPTITKYFGEHMGTPAERLHYIPNGIRERLPDAARRERVRASLGIGGGQFLLLFVGRLEIEKDVPTLLASAAHVEPGARAALRLLIAGDGSQRAALEAQAASLGLGEAVKFLGARRDVEDLMRAADAFIMTSLTEGQPMAMIEAMATGLPCIGTAVGGIPKMLDGDAGVLVPPSKPAEIAAAIAALMADAPRRASIGARARERVLAGHGMDAVIARYMPLLGAPSARR
jgi:glycosyltransferase involved in cell wall biosynthesis